MDEMIVVLFFAILVTVGYLAIRVYLQSKPVEFKLNSSLLEMPPGYYSLKKTVFCEIIYANNPLIEEGEHICDGQIIPQTGFWKKGIGYGTPLHFVKKSDFETEDELCFRYYPSSGKFVEIDEKDKK